jgi:hypothetical protein
MNESLSGVILGVVGFLGLTYLAIKVRQNKQRLYRMVGVIDDSHFHEIHYLLDLADAGKLTPYSGPVSAS